MSDKYKLQTLSGSISIGKGDKGDQGPVGPQGPQGPIGDNNVCVGTSPTDEAEIWFDTSSDGGGEAVATLKELQKVDQRVSEIIASNGGGVKDNEIIDAREGEICLGDKIRKISSSLDTKANKREVDNNINELDVKIAENKSLTDSEISKLKEIANTWETFKNTGGEIGGDISTTKVKSPMLVNESEYTVGMWNKGFGVESTDKYGSWAFVGTNSQHLGHPNSPWADLHLSGVSKSQNGYTKLPNGMIMQWGTYNQYIVPRGTHTTEITMPICYPKENLFSCANINYNYTKGSDSHIEHINVSVNRVNGDKLKIKAMDVSNLDVETTFEVFWFSLGY